jgi:hypothetical protein
MPKYAQYDSGIGPPFPVVGWYDTDALNYATLPSPSIMVLLTDVQWSGRGASDYWAIASDGITLEPYTLPAPSLTIEQQAATAVVSGLTITLGGALSFAATLFPTDTTTQVKITSVVTTIVVTNAFPNGAQTYPMIDSSSTWHVFNIGQYMAIASAIANYVSALYLIADGNPFGVTVLPPSSISLVV